MSTPQKGNGDNNISYPLDEAEGRPSANESHETVQAERSKLSHIIFL